MDNGACSYRRFLDGDENAFDEIMNEMFDNLVFFINGYVHDFHASEDIAIDAFTELIAHPNKYNFKVSLKTYLFMIGRSRALNYIKRKKIIIFTNLSEVENTVQDDEYEKLMLTDERKYIINSAMVQLSENERSVVHLIYFEDMTYDQAAAVMKKNRKQIDNLLYNAKKKLREILGEEGSGLL